MDVLFKLNYRSQQRQLEKERWIYPVELAMYATYLRDQGNNIVWDGEDDGSFNKIITSKDQIDVDFSNMPYPDRALTDASNPKWWKNNGNFKFTPGAYTQATNTCWYKKCTFCIETKRKIPYEVRSVNSVLDEIVEIRNQGFKEVFDDSATFPDGEWLRKFCFYKRFLLRKFPISCNMRIGADVNFKEMKDAGFRMLLFGVESANQKTLDKIKKGINYDEIIPTIKQAARAGLEPHIAVMLGYPWEDNNDTDQTLALVHYLLRKGYAKTAQASFYTTNDSESSEEAKSRVKEIYKVAYHPEFWVNKIRDLKSWEDLRYLYKQIKVGIKER